MTITAAKLYSAEGFCLTDKNSEKLEREFFSMIRMRGRINKTTWPTRLADVDELLEKYVADAGLSPTQYLDVGVSSGISTWDWCQRLRRSGRQFHMAATDLVFNTFLLPVSHGMKVLADRHGTALQYDFFGYGIRPGRPRPRDWLNGVVLISFLMGAAYRLRLRRYGLLNNQDLPKECSSVFMVQPDIKRVQLISPRIPKNNLINFIEHDLFTPIPEEMRSRFDVIRVANLLNRDYFGEDDMLSICRSLKECMAHPNSLLVVCRTRSDNSNHGTIFRLSDEKALVPVMRIGGGSEIETVVMQA